MRIGGFLATLVAALALIGPVGCDGGGSPDTGGDQGTSPELPQNQPDTNQQQPPAGEQPGGGAGGTDGAGGEY